MFRDRTDAGKQLAEALDFLRGRDDVIVLAIPRGGVVVGFDVARALRAPLDLWFSRKIGAPENPEFAIGSVAATGEIELDPTAVSVLRVSRDYIENEAERQRAEIERRMKSYGGRGSALNVENQTVVLVDDGLATGSTALSALKSLRKQKPAELILAVPVAPPDTIARLRAHADKIIALHTPRSFAAVGQFYDDFGQTSDEEVIEFMRRARQD